MTLAVNLANVAIACALTVLAAVLMVIEAADRERGHRFAITMRHSHVGPARRGRWRWYLHPTFSPDAIDVIVGAGRTDLAGWARTPLGALIAARRSRRHLEAQLERDRAEFVDRLHTGVVDEEATHAVFPAETREELG